MNLYAQDTCSFPDDTRIVPLNKGYFALVDSCDYERVMQYKWFVKIIKSNGLIYAKHRFTIAPWTTREVDMANFIMRPPSGMIVDHIDRARTLDNRRINLRPATRRQNMCNRKIPSTNTTGHKGVCWDRGKYKAYINVSENKIKHLGRFATLEEAVKVRIAASQDLYWEFHRIS
jgi:hypothetical protein